MIQVHQSRFLRFHLDPNPQIHLEVVKLLLKCPKLDITVRNKYGDDALESARKNGKLDAEIERAFQSRQTLLQQGHTC